jgi:hypothetical protein
VADVDGVQADAVLADDLQPRQGRVDDAGGDGVVAVEQAVEAAVGGDELQHLLLPERPAGADDLEAGVLQHVVVPAGGVLEAGGRQQDSHRQLTFGAAAGAGSGLPFAGGYQRSSREGQATAGPAA